MKVDTSDYDAYEKAWDNYTDDYRELSKGASTRSALVAGGSILGLGAAGAYFGAMTGTGGGIAGAVIGAGAGLTAGAVGGLYLGKDKGFDGLGYMVLGGAAASALAGYGGYVLGASSSIPVVGAVAGGLAGVAVGFGLSQKLEKALEKNLKKKHGI